MKPSQRISGIDLSIIRQINALGTALSINLGLGEPNIEPDERLREMARQAAGSGSWRYTPNAGSAKLRTLIAHSLGRSWDPHSEICVTAGTQEALFAISQAWIDPGDEVLIPDPGFLSYEVVVRLAGGTAVTYDLDPDSWQPDPDGIARRITDRTRAIIVNSPSNPTGGVIAADTLQQIAALAADRGILVISDEVYREIYYGKRPSSMSGMGRHVIVVSGLSKSHGMTGLRLGWIAAHEDVMTPIIRAHQYIATCASAFSQQLAEAVLEDADWNASWLENLRARFAEQREAALHAARTHMDIDVAPPSGAFYLFVPVPVCETLPLAKSLATDAAVLAIPGIAFGQRGEGFLRISYASSVDAIGTGIRRIGEYLSGEELRIQNSEFRK